MPDTRREFLIAAAAAAASAASLARAAPRAADPPAGISPDALRAAEEILGIRFTDAERNQIAKTIGEHTELLASIRKQGDLPNSLAPATVFRARLPDRPSRRVTTSGDPDEIPAPPPLPSGDEDIAFAPLVHLAGWLRAKALTSERLTAIYLERLARVAPTLHCAITITAGLAREQAKRADRELRAGRWQGPLHGVPYGLKDIVDTAGIATTWGAEPWRDRVPETDAWVTQRLEEAGAVLVAKTAVGALAYGDIWFGGTCRSPWNTQRGSSGSSAGSAAGVAAGLFGFAIGTETLGSIVSPCDRCGAAGLRPTFGRVPRTGVMALVWSMDKIGALARSVADTALVLHAINGLDPHDASSVDEPFHYEARQSARGLRVGIDPSWKDGHPYAASFAAALDAATAAGCEIVELPAPSIDPTPAILTLYAEAAAAFDAMTRSNADDQLSWQADEAWPNSFRRTHLLAAVDLVQADRIRRRTMEAMHDFFESVDCVLAPPFASGLLVHTNATGQPCAVVRAGFTPEGEPQAVTILGRVFDEGTVLRVAAAIEAKLGLWTRRPPLTGR